MDVLHNLGATILNFFLRAKCVAICGSCHMQVMQMFLRKIYKFIDFTLQL